MTISTFTAGLEQSHWVTRSNLLRPGPAGQVQLQMGDNTKTGGSDARRSTYHSWDLAGGVPKHAIVDEAYIEFVPTDGTGADLDDPDFTHVMALMYADGHWNRSAQNELHQAQGGAFYHAPSQTDSLAFAAYNSAGAQTANTMPDITGFTYLANDVSYLQALGTTVEIPAGEDIKEVRMFIARLHAPLPADPELTVNLYTLSGDGRQFSLDTLVASSEPVAYSSLTAAPGLAIASFTFTTAIPSQADARWVGLMIEGEIFDPTYLGTQSYQILRRVHISQTSYLSGTAGSMINADPDTDIANANSIVGYKTELCVPCLYPISSSALITTPYPRYFGTVMSKTQCGPWNLGVPKSYGSAVADEEFPNFVQNIQDWIDSDFFSPGRGKTWLGMMIDIALPENTVWFTGGPGHGTYPAHKLVIDWHPRPSAARASARALQRVAAGQSRAIERVVSGATARHRVTAASSTRPRVAAPYAYAALRVRAPLSNARSGV